ncbi:tail fiber assembly protein [Salmonella enterica subsp. enterica serovar Poona]|uniref:tail fiber assembly protein n=1 Tax=Enterobacter asburiae TaxID=61645 RepID=UPI0012C131E1|nr:tail fiber assembly protein [Enterobacter asburiae]EBS2937773.1 tail fiber assembly protein [Salmonella enterica subsp. enterica serovar Poona]EBV3684917.1 tail fiber assembly protein [Salmonella enterica subsp. enterica serovar Poona]EBZ8624387.1 tail fiber assembly protein [Salmonella enterica subsp. enterica serovar Poona]ECA5941057.1 tail fiber assembly protein [Salmonella enterica subsp. enterica serovar Poona]ECB1461894.1 tail fiber assembly protein [Salmonella enterica subsp. enteric
MAKAELNQDMIATVAGEITVYNYDGETREYLSSSVEYLAVGVGIPANSCIDAPGESKEGSAICRTADFTAWDYVADHRGETVYSTETGEALAITAPGDYLEGTTTLAPATPYDTWNGSDWVTDTEEQHIAEVEAAEQQKSAFLAEAKAAISLWQTELQLGILSDKDKASLILWLTYIKELQVVVPETAPNIEWPTPPAELAS